jgi:tetratricopeptide (TPR) repeat protein
MRARLYTVALVAIACYHAPQSPPVAAALRTTTGAIAVANLEASLQGLEDDLAGGRLPAKRLAELSELHAFRAQFLGQIADLERAEALAERLMRARPWDGAAYLIRGKARGALHRFPAALADFAEAVRRGGDPAAADSARASVLQAVGRYEEALSVRERQAVARPTIVTLGALASLSADRGDLERADRLFDAAIASYRDASPFPVAWVRFQQGTMWMRAGVPSQARERLAEAHRRLPQYVAAITHLGETEAALGHVDRAVELLRAAAESSGDPDPAAQLARVLTEAGRTAEASPWRERAARGFEPLLASHREAFADHAAEFWLGAGRDPARALALARWNLELRPTPRARELARRCAAAAAAAGGQLSKS